MVKNISNKAEIINFLKETDFYYVEINNPRRFANLYSPAKETQWNSVDLHSKHQHCRKFISSVSFACQYLCKI